ncbi:hypothetical protein FB451DRAFT_1170235 [Mycena latifolia]|nr:hypothetical protein FB451DRAFT_1170235 [Mycena latifolia]
MARALPAPLLVINPSALPGPAAPAPPRPACLGQSAAHLELGYSSAPIPNPYQRLTLFPLLPHRSRPRFKHDTWLPWLTFADYGTAPIAVVLIYGPAVPAAGMPHAIPALRLAWALPQGA